MPVERVRRSSLDRQGSRANTVAYSSIDRTAATMRAVKAVGPGAESPRICQSVWRRAAQHGCRYLSCARRFRLNSAPKLMQLLDITLPTLAENLALDDALLDEAEQAGPGSALRAPRGTLALGAGESVSVA